MAFPLTDAEHAAIKQRSKASTPPGKTGEG